MTDPLPSWNDTPTRQAIVRFVEEVTGDGDIPMLAFAGGPSRPGLRLLVLHDDPAREFDYVAGAEQALKEAAARGWTVVSIKRDWATVFGGT